MNPARVDYRMRQRRILFLFGAVSQNESTVNCIIGFGRSQGKLCVGQADHVVRSSVMPQLLLGNFG